MPPLVTKEVAATSFKRNMIDCQANVGTIAHNMIACQVGIGAAQSLSSQPSPHFCKNAHTNINSTSATQSITCMIGRRAVIHVKKK